MSQPQTSRHGDFDIAHYSQLELNYSFITWNITRLDTKTRFSFRTPFFGQVHHNFTTKDSPAQVKSNMSSSGIAALSPRVKDVPQRHGHSSPNPDVEELAMQSLSAQSDRDPLGLSSGIRSINDIRSIQANTSQKRGLTTSNRARTKKLLDFYTSQNESIERLLKPVDQHVQDAADSQAKSNLKYKIAVYGSLIASFVLAGLQLYGAISSGSLSIITTMADSIFDPISNTMLLLSHKAINKVDPRKYPSGRARIETVGNITFSFVMCAVSLILIVVSIMNLVEGSETETLDFHVPSIIAVSIAFATKLVLFLYCLTLRGTYSQVEILWQDHRNDLLINGFGILTSVGGSKLRWWIDPMGAIILSALISGLWSTTAWREFRLLIGVSADPQFQQLITYVGMSSMQIEISLSEEAN